MYWPNHTSWLFAVNTWFLFSECCWILLQFSCLVPWKQIVRNFETFCTIYKWIDSVREVSHVRVLQHHTLSCVSVQFFLFSIFFLQGKHTFLFINLCFCVFYFLWNFPSACRLCELLMHLHCQTSSLWSGSGHLLCGVWNHQQTFIEHFGVRCEEHCGNVENQTSPFVNFFQIWQRTFCFQNSFHFFTFLSFIMNTSQDKHC